MSGSAFAGAGAVREGHLFDEAALARWMAKTVPDFEGPLSVQQFKGGQSNPTYKVVTPTRSYVMRRKPPGQLLKGGHAVEREARALSALETVGFPIPTSTAPARTRPSSTLGSALWTWWRGASFGIRPCSTSLARRARRCSTP